MAEALKVKVNTAVTDVIMASNYIRDARYVVALTDALKVNTAVKRVYIGYNNIGDAGCAALAEVLEMDTVVTYLGFTLNCNNIGDAGCAALADALKVNTSETHVNIWLKTASAIKGVRHWQAL